MAWVVLIGLTGVIAWYADVRLRPWKACPRCSGRGRLAGILVDSTHADCGKCGAKGRVRRFGARKEG